MSLGVRNVPICEICRSKLKNPKSSRHINSKKHQAALKKQGKSTLDKLEVIAPIIPTRSVSALDLTTLEPMIEKIISPRLESLENRILELERLIKSNKTDTFEKKIMSKKNFQERLRYHYNRMNTQERRGGMVPIPRLWDELSVDGFSRNDFVSGLYELERQRIIELQTASDPKVVRDAEKAIDHPSRGLINYVIWRR